MQTEEPYSNSPLKTLPAACRSRRGSVLVGLGILVAVAAPSLAAQQAAPGDSAPDPQAAGEPAFQEPPPPPNFASAETARSRNCVPLIGRLEAVSAELDPRGRRAERISALYRAVSAEDSLRVTPLSEDDPLERAVGEWFRIDHELALEYLETEEEGVREDRQARREAMLERLEQEFEEVSSETEEILESTTDLRRAIQSCQGRIFVRSSVLEACEGGDTASNPLCEAARASEPTGGFQFVENATDLWDIEQLRPWSEPSRLQPAPGGGLAGARTAAVTRRGNIRFVLGLEPLFQHRDSLPADHVEGLDAHLDSLGITFEHPDFVMSPTLGYELDVPGRLGDETEYLLHFGDLSNPDQDVLQRIPVPERWPVGGAFTPSEAALVRLVRGDPVNITAVSLPEDGVEAEPVFSIGLTNVQQSPRVNALLQYMMSGQLGSDLAALVPPEDEAGDAPQP
ncbi:MAG: hypothetical protein R3223_05595 [Longimicrobiales bacterium]|nr:hypothetical protein [Longimicrobiales bacterium]